MRSRKVRHGIRGLIFLGETAIDKAIHIETLLVDVLNGTGSTYPSATAKSLESKLRACPLHDESSDSDDSSGWSSDGHDSFSD